MEPNEHLRYLGCLKLLADCYLHLSKTEASKELRESILIALNDAVDNNAIVYHKTLNRIEIALPQRAAIESIPLKPKSRIISNKVRCKLCNDIIESRHTHDFNTCKCGNISVDGGKYYLRRVGCSNYEELSEYYETDS